MSRVAPRFLVLAMAMLLATGWLSATPQPASAAPSLDVVISEVYGGGGNSGATLTNDFIELYNRGSSAVDISTWSVQYFPAAPSPASQWQKTNLAGSIAAGGRYLIQEGAGAGGTTPLPTPDASGNIAMAAGSGTVALVTSQTTLPQGVCPATAPKDLVGYGTALCREGTAAPTLSNTTSASRAANGADTDQNSADFTAGTPDPQNSGGSTPSVSLSIDNVSQSEGQSGMAQLDFTVSLSSAAGAGGVTFDIATSDGPAPNATAGSDYVAKSLTNQSIAQGNTTYAFSVTVNGDADPEADENLTVTVSNVTGATVADGTGTGTLEDDDTVTDPCADTFTPIYQIQGSGTATPIAQPNTTTTQGIVVGDFEGTAANSGFFIQDPTGDGNAATSDGLFVFTGAGNAVDAGDLVRVTGNARERFNTTALNGSNSNTAVVTDIVICSTGNELPAPTEVLLPVTAVSDFERYEGMLVKFPQNLVIAEYFNYDRFGEIVLALPLDGESRPFTGTALDEPGVGNSPANQRTNANLLRRITLDDNQSAQNPPVLRHPNGQPFSLTNRFRGGDEVENAVGVLGFDFNLYRIFPTGPADYTAVNPRPAEPEDVGGGIRVAAMNTLNFFVTADIEPNTTPPAPGDNVCGGNANLECRGWDSNQPDELTRQRDKLVRALAGLDADVLGLNELENTPGVDPLADDEGIVPALNELLGGEVYDSIETGVIGTDAIRVGIIYKPDVVTPVGGFQVLDSTDDPRFIDTRSRPALAQTFEVIATGARFTVVVNHLKSKGSACTDDPAVPNDFDDPDILDGQGNCNLTRTAAAKALVDWIATDPTGSGDPDFLIMGDLNSYAKEDPIDAIKAGADDTAGTDDDWTNLIEELVEGDKYSYVFDGQAGYLDHALANASIVDQVAGVTEWHINADEPDVLDYDTSFKPAEQDALYEVNQFRTSDHDPVLVGLDLVNDAPTIGVTAGTSCTANGGTFAIAVDDTEVAAGDLTLSLVGNSNGKLVSGVTFGGDGATRTANVVLANGKTGTATLTIGVNDGFQTTTTTITVTVGGNGADVLLGTTGAELLIGANGNDSLSGGGGADVLCGGNGSDALVGGAGNDLLDGDKGDDALSGGAGNDGLVGGQGSDSLTGGADADRFSGGQGSDINTDLTSAEGDTSDGT